MKITLVGTGDLTLRAKNAIESAEMLIGAQRVLDTLDAKAQKRPAVRTDDIINIVKSAGCERVCAVFSGDTGRAVGINISSKQGAAFHAMNVRHGGIMPTEDQITVRKGKPRKTKRDIPDVYTVHWADGKVDRFTSDGEPYTSDAQFD